MVGSVCWRKDGGECVEEALETVFFQPEAKVKNLNFLIHSLRNRLEYPNFSAFQSSFVQTNTPFLILLRIRSKRIINQFIDVLFFFFFFFLLASLLPLLRLGHRLNREYLVSEVFLQHFLPRFVSSPTPLLTELPHCLHHIPIVMLSQQTALPQRRCMRIHVFRNVLLQLELSADAPPLFVLDKRGIHGIPIHQRYIQ